MSDFEDRLVRSLAEGAEDAPGGAGLAAGARLRARSRRRRTAAGGAALAVAAVVLPLALVTGGDETATDGAGGDLAASALDELQVTCGSGDPSWPVAAMDGGRPGLVDEDAVRAAFADVLAEAPMDAPRAILEEGAAAAPWIALAGDAEGYTLGIGTWTTEGPGADASVASVETQADGTLRMTGWGDCQLQAALPEGQAPVRVSAPTGGVDAVVTDPVVMVNEVDCTSGRDPGPHLSEPVVVEDEERVVVTMSSDSVTGNADCQGNPSVPLTLRLDEPIGDRELLDGGTWPPTPLPVADAGEGWQTVVHEGPPVNDGDRRVVLDLPESWELLDTSGCEFEIPRYGPAGADPCSELGAHVLGSATFDPKFGPGLRPAAAYGDIEGEWLGHVGAGEVVVSVQTDDKQTAQRVLGSLRLPGDPALDLSGEWQLVNERGVSYEVPPRAGSELSVQVVDRPGDGDDTSAYAREDGDGRWLATMTLPEGQQIRVTAPTRALAELVAGSAGNYPVD